MKKSYVCIVLGGLFMHAIGLNANFGSSSIARELYDYICNILPYNSTILELGSGWGTSQLTKHYNVFSIEHDKKWCNKYDSFYIYAPLRKGWYDVDILRKNLPSQYDLILVDGPPAYEKGKEYARSGFLKNLHLFNTKGIIIIFDDVDRSAEFDICTQVAQLLNRDIAIHNTTNGKKFAVLLP